MQRLSISHLTEYTFGTSVTLQPHQLFLRPREGHDVRIASSKLTINPSYQIKWHRDAYDNSVATVRFTEPTDRLSILSEVVIEHYEDAPLDFLVEDYALHYPFIYQEHERIDLEPFLRPVYPNDEAAMKDWIGSLGVEQQPVETYVLLDRINQAIANNFELVIREEPGVQSPSQTLEQASGSCRDLAALFMEAARHLNLASRFVSGYLHAPATEAGNAATHAWAEVYLPGPGWKGFDASGGELASTEHIAVAVARHPQSVPPVAGSFVGPSGLLPALIVNVRVTAI